MFQAINNKCFLLYFSFAILAIHTLTRQYLKPLIPVRLWLADLGKPGAAQQILLSLSNL